MRDNAQPMNDRQIVINEAKEMLRICKEAAPNMCPDFCPDITTLHQHLSGMGMSEVNGKQFAVHMKGQRNADSTWIGELVCEELGTVESVGFHHVMFNDKLTWMLEYIHIQPELPQEHRIYTLSTLEAVSLLFE